MTIGRFLLRLTPIVMLAAFARPTFAQDAADMVVRVGRLEGQIRQLQGQIEQLQYQNRRLEEQLKKFEEDVEFRFQEGSGQSKPARPAAAAPVQGAPQGPQGTGPTPVRPLPAQVPQKRGDAFDPSLQPNAPGAPRPLGTSGAPPVSPPGVGAVLPADTDPSDTIIAADAETPAPDDIEQGPLDLATAAKGAPAAPESTRLAGLPARAPAAGDVSGEALPPLTGTLPAPSAGASATPGADEYEQAYLLVQQRQYDQAEMAFRQFLQSHPKDKMAPHALYWLGESYLRRSRFEDAAEQYLKVYQNYGRSRVAPDSLVKLASALRGMGQKDQACATLAEVGRKYPGAPADVRASVEREQKRAAC